jgi:hypothetical protein
MVTSSASVPTASAVKPSHDTRGFWRILLAVLAPLPWVARAVYYAIMPDSTGTFRDLVVWNAAHPNTYATLQWLDAAFVMLIVPAAFTVAWVARRGAPRLATIGALLLIAGFLGGIGLNVNDDRLAYTAAAHHFDPAVIAQLDTALQNNPVTGLGGLLFICGLVIGSVLLGIALWRSHAAPAWAGIALAVGGFTHPFLPGPTPTAIGLLILAIGFGAASIALLRTNNDDFDLPPARV